jgi:carbamoyl-phosphate synthase large subunit
MMKNGEIDLVINTTEGKQAIKDSASIRRSAENGGVYYTTTLAAAEALCMALRFGEEQDVRRLQDLHGRI